MAGKKHTVEDQHIVSALYDLLQTPNESDSNLEIPNMVDALFEHARAINRLATILERGLQHIAEALHAPGF